MKSNLNLKSIILYTAVVLKVRSTDSETVSGALWGQTHLHNNTKTLSVFFHCDICLIVQTVQKELMGKTAGSLAQSRQWHQFHLECPW